MRLLTPDVAIRHKPRFVVVRATRTQLDPQTREPLPGTRQVIFFVCDMLDKARVLREFPAKDASETAVENARKYASRCRVMFERAYVANLERWNGNGRP